MTRYQLAGIGNAAGAGLIGWGLGWGIIQHHWIWAAILIPAGVLISAPRHIMTYRLSRKVKADRIEIDVMVREIGNDIQKIRREKNNDA
jgi:hypothetical protein